MKRRGLFHKLFTCPTFWSFKPAFKCPVCGKTYRCYWDGCDVIGVGIDLCLKCGQKKNDNLDRNISFDFHIFLCK